MSRHPEPIDLTTWARTEHLEHYLHRVPCSFSLTVDLDVTALVSALRAAGRRLYAAQTWSLAACVNRHEAFRTTLVDDVPAVWPELDPQVTVLNPDRGTFAGVPVPWHPEFDVFHDQMADLVAEHRTATQMFPLGPRADVFDVSSLPWLRFSAFSLHVDAAAPHLLPIFTLGRLDERDDRTVLPLAIQVHHAAADGWHVAQLVEDLQRLVDDPVWVG